MATDLFGKAIGGNQHPEVKLDLQQKRQATMLYHWMSLDYLKGLKTMIDALIKGADVNLELAKRQGRDALIANERWGVRDTSANWSTHVYPALEDFRKSTIWHLAARAVEEYGITGANQCGRMLQEYSSMWMTEEEEKAFNEQAQKVYHYASYIDYAAGVGGAKTHLDDYTMNLHWRDHAAMFARLPRFRVRTDVVGVSDRRPPRTGVYVPQDDPYGTLQFAWTGNEDGVLGDAQTFNDLGLRMVNALGRPSLWSDDARMASFALAEWARNPGIDAGPYTLDKVKADPSSAGNALAFAAFTTRPCAWYFVEKVEGEFDDETNLADDTTPQTVRLRCEAGQPCPREGYWFTPASPNSRRHFKVGDVMPEFKSDYGATIWQWDDMQG